jgi:membrane-associated protease RseP (regulator of RpoE activity)
MTDDQTNEPLEPLDPGAPVPPPPPGSEPSLDAPTVEAPVASASTTAPGSRRASVPIPVWALAAVGGVLLLVLGFLAGWVLAPGDGDGERAASPSGSVREVPFGGDFAPMNPDGNGNGSGGNGIAPDPWDNGNGNRSRSAAVYLGVVVQDSSSPKGTGVARVAPASPASRAGLADGDVITAVDKSTVGSAAQLTQLVRAHHVGDRVTITYSRSGSSKTVEVRLGRRPQLRPMTPPSTRAQF